MRLLNLRPSIALAATVAALSACDSIIAPGDIFDEPLVSVETASINDGAIIEMRADNRSATDWSYNACGSPRLQRLVGGEWQDAPPPLILCTAELSVLGAGQELTIGVGVPVGYVAGTYRIRFAISRQGGVQAAPVSNSFEVE